jgi:hypothetical protein
MRNAALYGILVILIAGVVYMAYSLRIAQQQNEQLRGKIQQVQQRQQQEEIEVADVMTKLQRHAAKLWFAGQQAHWSLADFYVDELEEGMEEIAEEEVVEDGVNISELMKVMGLQSLKPIREAITEQDKAQFEEKYRLLIRSCNDCHNNSNYEFIKVTVPTAPTFSNQQFEPEVPSAED